jgi:hypothetical protein
MNPRGHRVVSSMNRHENQRPVGDEMVRRMKQNTILESRRIICALLLLISSVAIYGGDAADGAVDHSMRISVSRVALDKWRVDYQLSEPVKALDYGNIIGEFRRKYWEILSEDCALTTVHGAERITSAKGEFTSLSELVTSYTEFLGDQYVAVSPYSDGGASVYLGHFAADVVTGSGTAEFPIHYQLASDLEESIVLPGHATAARDLYAYFGNAGVIENEHARVLIDPATPEWLRDVFMDTIARTTSVFTRKLKRELERKPFVFIAAGELMSMDSFSVKGGAMAGEFVQYSLKGKALLTQDPDVRNMMQRLMSHELVHLWQQNMVNEELTIEEPWILEGSAEAMALQGLVAAGLWKDELLQAYSEAYAKQCREGLKGKSIAEAVAAGNYMVVYPCGFNEFSRHEQNAFELWRLMTREAVKQERAYSQALLDELVFSR